MTALQEYIYMAHLVGSAVPQILSINMVSYDASAMVYSLLIRLLGPHLTGIS